MPPVSPMLLLLGPFSMKIESFSQCWNLLHASPGKRRTPCEGQAFLKKKKNKKAWGDQLQSRGNAHRDYRRA